MSLTRSHAHTHAHINTRSVFLTEIQVLIFVIDVSLQQLEYQTQWFENCVHALNQVRADMHPYWCECVGVWKWKGAPCVHWGGGGGGVEVERQCGTHFIPASFSFYRMQYSPGAHVFCLLHKMDLISNFQRQQVSTCSPPAPFVFSWTRTYTDRETERQM